MARYKINIAFKVFRRRPYTYKRALACQHLTTAVDMN